MREPRKLPLVLSPEEVAQLLEAAPGIKYKAALSVAYGAGLRASEVVALKVGDIDSKRMLIRVEQGKGRKDRYAMLSPAAAGTAARLVAGGAAARLAVPRQEPGQSDDDAPTEPGLPYRSQPGEIDKRVSPHTLRHSFATHLLEQNIDIRVIQVLLGQAKLETTALYTRVATKTIREVMSPLDRLTCKPRKNEPPA